MSRYTSYNRGSTDRNITQVETAVAVGLLNHTVPLALIIGSNNGYPGNSCMVRFMFTGTDLKLYKFKFIMSATKCPQCPNFSFEVASRVQCEDVWHSAHYYHDAKVFDVLSFGDRCPLIVAPKDTDPPVEITIVEGGSSAIELCKGCRYKIADSWDYDMVEGECLVCMEAGPAVVYCLHCRGGKPCGKSHHMVHKECGIKYFNTGKWKCPTCKEDL